MAKLGDVFQIEIRVHDLDVAMAFYRNSFEWGLYRAAPSYCLVDTGHMPVVGLLQEPRLPIGASPLILVNDCEAAVARAKELGGRVMITRSEVPNSGAYTAALDPWGNDVYFWQQYVEGNPKLAHEAVNPFVFVELAVPNLEKAVEYYSKLMGWSFWTAPFTPDYAIAEGCGMKRGIGLYGGSPTHGIVHYLQVNSLEETGAKVTANGGEVVVPPEPFLNEGRYIIISDPSGNRLGCIEAPKPAS